MNNMTITALTIARKRYGSKQERLNSTLLASDKQHRTSIITLSTNNDEQFNKSLNEETKTDLTNTLDIM